MSRSSRTEYHRLWKAGVRVRPVREPNESDIDYILRTKVDASGDCWIWLSYHNGDGYGQVRLSGDRTKRYAYRVIYEALVAPIPEGMQLDHLCRNPRCVNPDHLEPVTLRENARRGASYGGVLRTHCKHGHAYADGIYSIAADGSRNCLRCAHERDVQRAERERLARRAVA